MKSYTVEMADGSGLSEGYFDNDKAAFAWAISVLAQHGYEADKIVADYWQDLTPDSVRVLFWANEEASDDDTGANAIAHLVRAS